jgi:hypothetical protein
MQGDQERQNGQVRLLPPAAAAPVHGGLVGGGRSSGRCRRSRCESACGGNLESKEKQSPFRTDTARVRLKTRSRSNATAPAPALRVLLLNYSPGCLPPLSHLPHNDVSLHGPRRQTQGVPVRAQADSEEWQAGLTGFQAINSTPCPKRALCVGPADIVSQHSMLSQS